MRDCLLHLGIGLALALAACDRAAPPAPQPPAAAPAAAAPPPTAEGALRIIFLGDSLTAGYGLPADEAFPALLGTQLHDAGLAVRVVNAGVSGDTTAGGLRRLDWLLRQQPDVVVVELGANDGLRGLDLDDTERNLRAIIQRARAAGAEVLLLGMMIPPNYGPEYAQRFAELYPLLAEQLDVPLVPFLLEGVGGEPSLNLPDGIHPTAEGHRRLAGNVLPALRDVVDQRAAGTIANDEGDDWDR